MRHPFQAIPLSRRATVFWWLLILTLAVSFLMNLIGAPLNTPAAPAGIVSFELAGSVEQAQAILASWDANAQLHAALSLGFDYVYMLVYAASISLACLMAGDALRRRGWPGVGLAVPLAWGQWLAAGFDALENLALILVLFGPVVDPWPVLARVCAIAKFALLFAGLVYALLGLVANILGRISPRS